MGYENVKVVEQICKQIDLITQKEKPENKRNASA
jgi:hypothetical protein